MKSKPLVALLTDFGMKDWFVPSMKGVIKGIVPEADIIDITHEITRQNIEAAAFVLESCYRDFPEGTAFCCVVDPGVGTNRKRIAATDGTYFFIAPDNGLLAGISELSGDFETRIIDNKEFKHEGPGTTFDGRDVFAPAAAKLASGTPFDECGPICEEILRSDRIFPEVHGDSVIGRVIYIDHFGNLVTSLREEDMFPEKNPKEIRLKVAGHEINAISGGYADVKEGAPLIYTGSTGRLEVAINKGNAAKEWSVKTGYPVEVIF